jgi:hypothetical protein
VHQQQELQLRRVPQCELTSSIFLQGVLVLCASHIAKGVVVSGEPSISPAGNPKLMVALQQKFYYFQNSQP